MTDLSSAPPPLDRRYDLDWIRIGAFMLLILYHVGMFYVPWDWHVNSARPVEALQPLMQLTNPWRLTLLFLVSGAATRFLFDGLVRQGEGAVGRFALSRLVRLLPPLAFAMLVVVPPQSYYQVIEQARLGQLIGPMAGLSPDQAVMDFYARYVSASGQWCTQMECLITPTWNHMWFVAYLLVYSLVLASVLVGVRRFLPLIQSWLERRLQGAGLLVWPVVFLALIRLWLAPMFPVTHALIDDVYTHALSFGAFGLGFVMARSEPIRAGFVQMRRPALILAIAAYAGWATYAWIFRADDAVVPEALKIAMRVVYAVDQWAFIAAILGYGARYLNRGGRALRYLSVGVFPFYIIHQTLIVVLAAHLSPLNLPQGIEAGVIISATFAGCFATYELARRAGWLGLLLGLKPPSGQKARA